MKTKFLLLVGLILSLNSKAQWVTKNVNNGIDEPYKIAYCRSTDNSGVLKLEKVDTAVAFYLSGGYHCDESTTVDIGLTIGSEIKRYSFFVYASSDRKTIFILDDIKAQDNADFLKDFQRCSKLSIRINESHCQDDYYSFIMTGSTKALQFISN
jgi:hypothetical protein